MIRVRERGLTGFESALFTVPCSRCGKPVLFTHKDENWTSEERPRLLEAFKDWAHTQCIEKEKEKYKLK